MASLALELLGFLLGLLGTLGTTVTTVLPYWQTSAHIGPNIVTAVATMRGLWMECVSQSTGAFQCETYNSLLALPADLQASRALMVISLVLSPLAIAVCCVGMQCTVCLGGGGDSTAKGRVAAVGGGLFVACGVLALVPVAWTTHEVVRTFYRHGVPQSMKFELGECLYVGMASALVTMLGGAMLTVSCCEERRTARRRRGGGGGGGGGGAGYPYPARGMSAVYRSHANANANANSRAQTLVRGVSESSQSTNQNAQKRNTGYDITGYV